MGFAGRTLIRYKYPTCQSILESPPRAAGSKIACPKCNQRIQVPANPLNKTVLGSVLSPGEPLSPKRASIPSQRTSPTRSTMPVVSPAGADVIACPAVPCGCDGRADLAGQWLKCPSCSAMFFDSSPPAASPIAHAMRATPPPITAQDESGLAGLESSSPTMPDFRRLRSPRKLWRFSSPSMLGLAGALPVAVR